MTLKVPCQTTHENGPVSNILLITGAVATVLPRADHSFWGRPGELMRGARS
jgi:D-lyxose ketol-isomerase